MQYKPFLGYRDVKEIMCCSTDTAYRIMNEVMTNVDKARMPPFASKRIPTDIFMKMYPSCRPCIKNE